MNIFIPIETASREFLYKAYLSCCLVENDCDVYLGSKANINALIQAKKNFAYLDKGYHEGVSDDLYRKIKSQGGRIANLDEEGAVDFANNQTLLNRYSKNLERYADVVFFWGKAQKELASFNTPDGSAQLVTGHPRFELLRPDFRFLYEEETKSLVGQYGDYILINTNMGFGNNINGSDFVVTNYKSRFPNIRELIEFDNLKVNLIIELVEKISKISHTHVVLRPHPEEDFKVYETAFFKLKNVSIIRDGSAVPWILGAKTVVHPDCTTAIEARIMGKIPISILPLNYDNNLVTTLPLKVSLRYTNASELARDIVTEKIAGQQPDFDNDDLSNFFYDASSPTKRIVKRLSEFKDESNFDYRISSLDFVFLKCRLKEQLSHLRHNTKQGVAGKKLKGFDYRNTKIMIDTFHSAGMFRGIEVKKLSKTLFRFSKSKFL